jgi:hypothetical protein
MTVITPPLERVPIEPLPPLSERERIHAAAQTAISLMQLDDDPAEITEEEESIARSIFADSRKITPYELQMPGVVIKLDALLSEYDYALVEDAHRIRNYVVNRLLEESTNPRHAIKALEMLGKLANVGLFVDRKEVHITNQSTEDIESRLRDSLSILLDAEDVTVIEPNPQNPPPAPELGTSVDLENLF